VRLKGYRASACSPGAALIWPTRCYIGRYNPLPAESCTSVSTKNFRTWVPGALVVRSSGHRVDLRRIPLYIAPGMPRCVRCGKSKNRSDFYRRSRNSARLRSSCKDCMRLYYRLRRRRYSNSEPVKRENLSVEEILALTRRGRAEMVCSCCGREQIVYVSIPHTRVIAWLLREHIAGQRRTFILERETSFEKPTDALRDRRRQASLAPGRRARSCRRRTRRRSSSPSAARAPAQPAPAGSAPACSRRMSW
jgi:hypothetical protein